MKFKLLILFVLFLNIFNDNSFSVIAEEKELDYSNVDNAGTEFYCSFIPTWQQTGKGDVWIYVFSKSRTKVTIEVPEKGFSTSKTIEANQTTKFILSTAIAQPYKKNKEEIPLIDQIFKGSGIHIYSDDPIVCYGATNDGNSSEGFLILPIQSLGNEYLVSSYPDHSTISTENLPSYTAIVGTYDKTSVEFTMGGSDWSKTAGGQKPGETTSWNISKGDVLLIAGAGPHSDLTGSKITSTKPVAVVSGHYCAKVPQNCTLCDILEEMETPTKLWGKTYHVVPIVNNPENNYIKIFAKESDTKIFRDNQQIGFLKSSGGIEGTGYLHMKADEGKARAILISGDKPIGVTQYNQGRTDANPTETFQFTLSPQEQFQKEIIVQVPGSGNLTDFPTNFLLLIYQTNESGEMPEDLEIGEYINGQLVYKKVSDIYGSNGFPFMIDSKGIKTSCKSIQLDGMGIYRIRNNTPIMAYIYSNGTRTYGFPATMGSKDLTKEDSLPPVPVWIECCGNINHPSQNSNNVGVYDKPDDMSNRSNIATIYLNSNNSYNYELWYDDFTPCLEGKVKWGLNLIDNENDARAVITFVDCSGNDTTIVIEYFATKIKFESNSWDAGLHIIGDSSCQKFSLINYGTGSCELTNLNLKNKDLLNKDQGFAICDESKNAPLTFPIRISPNDSLHFYVKFSATMDGEFWDSLGFGDTIFFNYKAYVSARVESPEINVKDCNFPLTEKDKISYFEFDIKNTGLVPLRITNFNAPTLLRKDNKPIFYSNDIEKLNICGSNPLILQPGVIKTFQVCFNPEDSILYNDQLTFSSNSKKREYDGTTFDSVCTLIGKGFISTGIEDEIASKIRIFPNPVADVINIENIPNTINKIQIFDVFGREVYSNQNIDSNLRISSENYIEGSYLVKINSQNYLIFKKIVVIK